MKLLQLSHYSRHFMLLYSSVLFFCGCSTITHNQNLPDNLDAVLVPIFLEKVEVANNTEHNLGISDSVTPLISAPAVAIIWISISWAIMPVVNKVFVGSRIFVYPEYLEDSFKQELSWGHNNIYLPENFLAVGGNLVFEAEGGRIGKWIKPYDPRNPYISIDDESH